MAIPLYGKNLVAEDFKGAAINVFLKYLTDVQYADLASTSRFAPFSPRRTAPSTSTTRRGAREAVAGRS